MKRKLSAEQKKIIYIAAIVAVSLALFLAFIYSPQKKKLSGIRSSLSAAEGEIAEINRITHGKPLEQAVSGLSLQRKALFARLPLRVEDVVKSLSEAAREHRVELRNTSFAEEKRIPGKVPGYTVRELPISMKLSSEYRGLGEYLQKMLSGFPVLVRIKQLTLRGQGEGQPQLEAELNISAYLLEASQ